jgi:hypothetical protein
VLHILCEKSHKYQMVIFTIYYLSDLFPVMLNTPFRNRARSG